MMEELPETEIQPEAEIVTVQDQIDQAKADGIAEGRQQMAERTKVLLLSLHGLSAHNVHQGLVSLLDKELGVSDTLRLPKRAMEALSAHDSEVLARIPVPLEPESEEDDPSPAAVEGEDAT